MNWPMYLTPSGVKPPTHLDANADEGIDQPMTLVGPSLFGWVYRSPDPRFWVRLQSLDQVSVKRRSELRVWAERPSQDGMAQVTLAQQLGHLPYFIVGYRTTAPAQSLTDALAASDPLQDLSIVLKILRQIAHWREVVGGPVLPMPADVLVVQDNPVLLGLPYSQLPQIASVFEAPERGLYLAPEIVRGVYDNDDAALDRYVIGIFLLRCFRKLPTLLDVDQVLLRAVTGTLVATTRADSTLPAWMERIREATQLALSRVYSLLTADPALRYAAPWETIAKELESCRKGMESAVAVREMWQTHGGESAFMLLQDILLSEESYELLMLGGKIAGTDLNRPLAAIELLERAITLAPPDKHGEAYLAHFKVVTGLINHPTMEQLCTQNPQVAIQIDTAVERDVKALTGTSDSLIEDWVDYLMWRGHYKQVVRVIYPRLHEGETLAFWRLRLNLQYAEALISLQDFDKADAHLKTVQQWLPVLIQNNTVSREEVHIWGSQLADMQRRLMILRKSSSFHAPPGMPTSGE